MKMSCKCQPKHPRPRKLKCCPGVEIDYIEIPVSAGTDEPGQPLAPENGAYKNAVVKYAANNHVYIYTSEGIPVQLSEGSAGSVFSVNGKTGDVVLTTSDLQNTSDYQNGTQVLNAINTAIGGLSIPSKTSQLVNDGATGTSTYVEATALSDEATARENADNGLQGQIDALSAASDVTDIVGTYAALEAYDTSTLGDNDIIKVLQDETHDDETTYYRWSTTTETFTLIGEEGPYYTKSAADQKFQDKLTAGTNISIEPLTDTISASFDAETIFYANLNEAGNNRHIYKDIAFTTAASVQELIDANNAGQVILRGTSTANPTAYSDSYLQNAFIMPHNNDFEFVFLDRDLRYEYTASATTDTVFFYSTSEIQPKLTAGTNINISGTTISATDTTYSNFTGTDGQTAGTAGLVPAPATTDDGKYLKADGTWDNGDATFSTGQKVSGLKVYSTPGNGNDGLITREGSRVTLSIAQTNPYRTASSYTWDTGSGAVQARLLRQGLSTVSYGAIAFAQIPDTGVQVGWIESSGAYVVALRGISFSGATASADGIQGMVPRPLTGEQDKVLYASGSWGINYKTINGAGAPTTSTAGDYIGELYLDTTNNKMYYLSAITSGNPDTYTWEELATKNYVDGDTETYTIADTDWSALTGAGIFTYSATVTATHTIGASTIAELINDQAVLFSTYGFAIGDITGQTVTIYSIGAPSSSVSLKINYKG